MKDRIALFAIGASLLALPTLASAQAGGDPTTPPAGVPGKVMKTLDEVEARIPLVDGAPGVSENANTGFTISQSGSYYLTGNISVDTESGIQVNASNVTVDLNGFTITGTGAATGTRYGIYTGFSSDVVVKNGFIECSYSVELGGAALDGSAFDAAIFSEVFFGLGDAEGIVVEKVSITGVAGDGIVNAFLVKDSTVRFIDGIGIEAKVVRGSIASDCEGIAIKADKVIASEGHSLANIGISATVVSDSTGESEKDSIGGEAAGIKAVTVSNSQGTGVIGIGIDAETVTNSIGISTDGRGISALTVHNSKGTSTNSIGIRAKMVTNSSGTSTASHGIFSDGGVVSFSFGETSDNAFLDIAPANGAILFNNAP